jgi:hypothetical protein
MSASVREGVFSSAPTKPINPSVVVSEPEALLANHFPLVAHRSNEIWMELFRLICLLASGEPIKAESRIRS